MKRICSYCGRIVDTNNHDCPNKPKDKRRGRQLAKESTRWKKIKAEVKARDLCCVLCMMNGHFTNYSECHHIVPREVNNNDDMVFNTDNCIMLCHDCHKIIHSEGWRKYKGIFENYIKEKNGKN